MKRNITLSIDQDLLQKARIISARTATSVSRLLSEELTRIVRDDEQYEYAKSQALANLRKGYHLGGQRPASRENLHER